MGGFSIGFGVGLRYPAPNKIKTEEATPPPEEVQAKAATLAKATTTKTTSSKRTRKTDKTYWNF